MGSKRLPFIVRLHLIFVSWFKQTTTWYTFPIFKGFGKGFHLYMIDTKILLKQLLFFSFV